MSRPVMTPKLLARIRGGHAANRSGDAFELAIRASVHDEQGEVVQLEFLPKCGAKFHGKGQAHVLPIACDVIGTIVGPGTALFFDAKAVGEKQYGIALNDPDIVKPHQARFLHAASMAGAVAGLLVECRMHGEYRWLDGRHLDDRRAYTAWKDERWILLGSTQRRVRFRDLVKAYLG